MREDCPNTSCSVVNACTTNEEEEEGGDESSVHVTILLLRDEKLGRAARS